MIIKRNISSKYKIEKKERKEVSHTVRTMSFMRVPRSTVEFLSLKTSWTFKIVGIF
jgi:hypothetical protein